MKHFVIDPPWPQSKGGLRKVRPNQHKELDYKTMSIDDIFSLLEKDVFQRGEESHNVFLWSIDKFLLQSDRKMLDLGYRMHTRIVWNKENGIAPAFTLRFAHEYVTWFYKGKFMPIAKEFRGKFTTVITVKSREHSRKPNEFYNIIDSMYPNDSKMDVFSREKRSGWEQFGNEINYF